MKHNLGERVLVGILLIIATGIVLHAPLTVWLGTMWPDYSPFIKAWKEVLMGVALVLLAVAVVRRKQFDAFMQDRLIQLALVYAGLHFVMIGVFQNGLQSAGAGLLIDLRYVLYFVLVYGAIRLYPHYRSLFIKVIVAGAAIVLAFGVLQIVALPKDILAHIGYSKATIAPYLTVDQNPDYVRINSTLRGPNPLGAYVVIVLSLLLAAVVKYRHKLQTRHWWLAAGVAVAGGLVINATYSRSSLGALLIALGVIVGVVLTGKARRYAGIGAAVALIGVIVLIFAAREHPVVSNLVWHDNPNGGSKIDSNEDHAESLADGFQRMVRQPLGAGVGSTGSASLDGDKPLIIENQYLFTAHEVGWLGLGLFAWLYVEVLRRLWSRRESALSLGVFASGVGLAVIGIVLPVWVDDTVSIIWWGLAGLGLGAWEMGKSKK